MTTQTFPGRAAVTVLAFWMLLLCFLPARAQSSEGPLTSQELVRLVYSLPGHPERRDGVVEEIRRRGLGFPLTDGIRGLVATKSGNDTVLRRTLEEAERRRLNPAGSSLPPEAEGVALLAKTRAATAEATGAMPDFIVRQLISRYEALNGTNNWIFRDKLTLGVTYRAHAGEDYKLLSVNGLPPSADLRPGQAYSDQLGGASSAGEYVTALAELFDESSQASFKMVDTDLLGGRRTIVYEYAVKQPVSKLQIKSGEHQVIAGYHGRVWIDREIGRVLRFEQIAELPAGFPITAASATIDYEWATISDKKYLLPSKAVILITDSTGGRVYQSRNQIRFRDYRKFGSELRIIEDDEPDEPPPSKP